MTVIAHVRWFDASYQRGECTLDELVQAVEIETAGLLVRETAECVSVALDYYGVEGTWRSIAHIPRVNIRRIRKIRVS